MAEIQRSPVEVGSLSHYLQGFIHPRWCRISAINSITIFQAVRMVAALALTSHRLDQEDCERLIVKAAAAGSDMSFDLFMGHVRTKERAGLMKGLLTTMNHL